MGKILLFPLLLSIAIANTPPKGTQWTGTVSNGMKGDKISFVVSPDGKQLSKLVFDGYWRCSGRLERQSIGPKATFDIKNGHVGGVVLDPPSGGSWRFDLQGDFTSKTASQGTFQMNITGLGCDTHKLQWAAAPTGPVK